MKLLLIVSAAIALSTAACASSPTPVASSRDAYLADRAELTAEQGVDCGQPGGQCTTHFHRSPKSRQEAKVEFNFFPIKGFKSELTSSLDR